MGGRIRRTLLLSIVLPLIAIQLLLHWGVAPVTALAIATIFPLIEMAFEFAQAKRIGVIAIVSLAGIVTGFALSFITGKGIFAVLKDSAFTFAFGILFLGSLLTPRPLIYTLNLDLAGGDATARAEGVALWEKPRARRAFRLLTIVWGIGLMLDALIRVAVTLSVPLATAAALSPIISLVVIGGLIVWNIAYVRAQRAVARAHAV
jgi:hypothetical protein